MYISQGVRTHRGRNLNGFSLDLEWKIHEPRGVNESLNML